MRVFAEGAGLTGLDLCIVLALIAIWMCAGGTGVFHTAGLVSFLNLQECLQKSETLMVLLCLSRLLRQWKKNPS